MNPDHHKYATLPDTPSLAVGQTSTSFGSRVSDADDDIADEELPIRHSRMSTGLLTAFCGIRCTDVLPSPTACLDSADLSIVIAAGPVCYLSVSLGRLPPCPAINLT